MHGAPARAGRVPQSISWGSILDDGHNGTHKQRWQLNNVALKWFRLQGEDTPGVPNCAAIEMDLASMIMEIGVIHHADKGTQYTFVSSTTEPQS